MSSRQILVVDDDPTARAILRGGLGRAGYATLETDSGRSVMRLIEQHAPALVVTDIFMDEQEGLETIMQVRAKYDSLPIIAISGSPEYLIVAREMGADRTLVKPIDVTRLLSEVAMLIGQAPSPPG